MRYKYGEREIFFDRNCDPLNVNVSRSRSERPVRKSMRFIKITACSRGDSCAGGLSLLVCCEAPSSL